MTHIWRHASVSIAKTFPYLGGGNYVGGIFTKASI
jgi:hypothetical protein